MSHHDEIIAHVLKVIKDNPGIKEGERARIFTQISDDADKKFQDILLKFKGSISKFDFGLNEVSITQADNIIDDLLVDFVRNLNKNQEWKSIIPVDQQEKFIRDVSTAFIFKVVSVLIRGKISLEASSYFSLVMNSRMKPMEERIDILKTKGGGKLAELHEFVQDLRVHDMNKVIFKPETSKVIEKINPQTLTTLKEIRKIKHNIAERVMRDVRNADYSPEMASSYKKLNALVDDCFNVLSTYQVKPKTINYQKISMLILLTNALEKINKDVSGSPQNNIENLLSVLKTIHNDIRDHEKIRPVAGFFRWKNSAVVKSVKSTMQKNAENEEDNSKDSVNLKKK